MGRGHHGQGNGVPGRHSATLQLNDNLTATISRKIAFQLIDLGELVMVKKSPLTVKFPKHKEFHEDQRHLSGRRIPGVSKGLFNGRYSTSGGLRVRVPRSAQSKDYVMTIGWVRQSHRLMVEAEEKKKAKDEKDKRRKAKRQRRRQRRRQMKPAMLCVMCAVFFMGMCQGQGTPPPLFWDANSEPDIDHYHLYSASSPCLYTDPDPGVDDQFDNPSLAECPGFTLNLDEIPQSVDPITAQPTGTLTFGVPVYYRVDVENTSGLMSRLSNELEVTMLNDIPPDFPTDLRDTFTGAWIIIEGDVATLNVVYKFVSTGPGSPRGGPRQ